MTLLARVKYNESEHTVVIDTEFVTPQMGSVEPTFLAFTLDGSKAFSAFCAQLDPELPGEIVPVNWSWFRKSDIIGSPWVCEHAHTEILASGGVSLVGGELLDDYSEELYCLDCRQVVVLPTTQEVDEGPDF